MLKQLKKLVYRHSGKISLPGVLLMPLSCFVTAAILGLFYGYLNFNNISIYFNVLFILLIAYFESVLISFFGRTFRVRNLPIMVLVSLLSGILIVYMSWVGWFYSFSVSFRSVAGSSIVLDPYQLVDQMAGLAQNGYWAVGEYMPKGDMLWSVWGIEALIPIMVCVYRPQKALERMVYCEACSQWVDDTKSYYPFISIDHIDDFINEIINGNFKQLAKLKRVPVTSTRYTQLDLIQCPACQEFHLLSIVEITRIMDSHGHDVLDRYPILNNYILSNENYEMIKQLFRDRSSPLNRKLA